MRRPAVHWIGKNKSWRSSFAYVFCGLIRRYQARKFSTHRNKVTCGNCLRLMKLHGHLEEEQ